MLKPFLLSLGVFAMLFGQSPRSVTVCICTGEIGSAAVSDTDNCQRHVLPECDTCKSSAKKGCYVSTSAESQTLADVCSKCISFSAILSEHATVIKHSLQSVRQVNPNAVIPRIREPDLSGHLLRGPPSLA